MANIKDIARLSGYSIGTVSRVINGRANVSEKARTRILEVIEQENYQPNANARLLKAVADDVILIVVKGIGNDFLVAVLERVQKELEQRRLESTVVFLDESANEADFAAQYVVEKRPLGILFLGGNITFLRNNAARITVPSVLVTGDGREIGSDMISSFCCDDYAGGKMAMEYLIAHGHTEIGIIGGYPDRDSNAVVSARIAGALSVLRSHGIPFDAEKDYEPSRFSMKDGFAAGRKLLARKKNTTAVFALSDMIGAGVIRAAHECGLMVPSDLSLIAFDGIAYTDYTVPRITTVRQDEVRIAADSVADLCRRINGGGPVLHEKIPCSILEKESVRSL
ncbi:MAG: LacI family DNA-binding transcriptional regulator [Solobacterium sp.]|nr:LacI family DNA-binding transcriptional regulator [Solobacterium sp.]